MKSWFQARGYPSGLIQKEMNKVKFSGHWDENKAKKKWKGVPLVIIIIICISNIIVNSIIILA